MKLLLYLVPQIGDCLQWWLFTMNVVMWWINELYIYIYIYIVMWFPKKMKITFSHDIFKPSLDRSSRQGLVNVLFLNITQLLGISSPTDICFGDVTPIPNSRDINPSPWWFSSWFLYWIILIPNILGYNPQLKPILNYWIINPNVL